MGTANDKTKDNPLLLSKSGRTDFTIVINVNASPAEQLAANDLAFFLQKVTGAAFPIKTEAAGIQHKAIYVGKTNYAKDKLGVPQPGDQEWRIKNYGDNLILTGGAPLGELYAVYEFLEQCVGCHWLDEFTNVIPNRPDLAFDVLDIKGKPAFLDRQIYEEPCYVDQDARKLFRLRNKETSPTDAKYGWGIRKGSPKECHTFRYYSQDIQDAHPEYLALNTQGERVKSSMTNDSGPGQICLTNPDMRKHMLGKLRQYIKTDRENATKTGMPFPQIYCIEANDNDLTCQCPACRDIINKEGSNSAPYIDLVNFLASGIKDEYPDVLIDTFAYLQTLHAPKTIKPADNVIIRIAQLNARPGLNGNPGSRLDERPDYFRPMTHPINRSCLEQFLAWGKISGHISYWDYWVQFCDRVTTPYTNIDCLKPDLELFYDNHVEAIFTQLDAYEQLGSRQDSSFWALERWVGLKLLQNPRQPVDPLIKTFLAGYYGPASGKMEEYLDYLRRRIKQCPADENISSLTVDQRPYLDLEFFETSERMLDAAEKMCATDKLSLLHVQKERMAVDSGLLGLWKTLWGKLPPGKKMPFEIDDVVNRYKAAYLAQINAFWQPSLQKLKLRTELLEIRMLPYLALRDGLNNKLYPPKPVCIGIPSVLVANGNADKVDWSKAARLDWRTIYGFNPADRVVTGLVAHDDKYLYLKLEEKLNGAKLTSKPHKDNGWEVFIAPQRAKPYQQIQCFPDGKNIFYRHVANFDDIPWIKHGITIDSRMKNDAWRLTVAIPLKSVTQSGNWQGKAFYANIYRGRSGREFIRSLCLSPTFSTSYLEPGSFAEMRLE